MKNTLKQNDLIITNKILYSSLLSTALSPLGIKGHPKRNDILVFEIPQTDQTLYVKRCIGLPGETIETDHENIIIDKKAIPDLPAICHLYKVRYRNYDILVETLTNSGIDRSDIVRKYPGCVLLNLDSIQKNHLLDKPGVDSITIFRADSNSRNAIFNLLKDDNGDQQSKPLLIPFQGMKIQLDSAIVAGYDDILQRCEGVILRKKQDAFFINEIKSEYYVFKKDYYFMIGDNRDNSHDSRAFGLIPKDCIEGKVIFSF
jgi:signal peptidase I